MGIKVNEWKLKGMEGKRMDGNGRYKMGWEGIRMDGNGRYKKRWAWKV